MQQPRRRPVVASWARDHCIAAAVRESVQLRGRRRGAAPLLSETKHQPRPSDPVLADLRADDREHARRTHVACRGGAWEQQSAAATPRRCNFEAGVRRLDTGRVVRHERSRWRRRRRRDRGPVGFTSPWDRPPLEAAAMSTVPLRRQGGTLRRQVASGSLSGWSGCAVGIGEMPAATQRQSAVRVQPATVEPLR
jgi:hypothetical protein